MQKTRQKILDYLRKNGVSTVNELSKELDDLTAVTVRHHLDILRSDGLVSEPITQKRDSPGRPKLVYELTDKGHSLYPGNIQGLADHVISEMISTLDQRQVNVIFEGVAERMAGEFELHPDEPIEQRIKRVVAHLQGQGYESYWESNEDGYVLFTRNCPYSSVNSHHDEICQMDMTYISRILGVVPRRLGHMVDGHDTCSYLIRHDQVAAYD